jgi:UDP-arabinose 4-epimerase
MSKNVLVTGGAGYVGSHACKALATVGFEPIAYDNLTRGHRWAVKWGPLVIGDVCDRVRLDRVMKRYRPMAVMHFAACAYVWESVENPRKYYRNNVIGSLNVLEAMLDHGVEKVVFSSSCATYGVPQTPRITEAHAQRPISPYGFTKLAIERTLQDFSRSQTLRYVALRYFNAAGADPDGEIGEDHDPEPHLIPRILDVALGRREHIEIYGTDYPTPDGTAIRDYVHVSDLAMAHVQTLEYLLNGGESTALNLGVGHGHSVGEVITAVEQITGKPLSRRDQPRRAGDPAVLVADASLAQDVLGWVPKYSTLQDIVSTAWQWHLAASTRANETKRGQPTESAAGN